MPLGRRSSGDEQQDEQQHRLAPGQRGEPDHRSETAPRAPRAALVQPVGGEQRQRDEHPVQRLAHQRPVRGDRGSGTPRPGRRRAAPPDRPPDAGPSSPTAMIVPAPNTVPARRCTSCPVPPSSASPASTIGYSGGCSAVGRIRPMLAYTGSMKPRPCSDQQRLQVVVDLIVEACGRPRGEEHRVQHAEHDADRDDQGQPTGKIGGSRRSPACPRGGGGRGHGARRTQLAVYARVSADRGCAAASIGQLPCSRLTRRLARNRTMTLGFVALSFALAFWQRPGWATTDTKIDLHVDPVHFLSFVASVWTQTTDLGEVHSSQYTGYLWPMGPFYALMHSIGLSAWVAQRVWLGCMFALAAWGMLKLMDVLVGRRRGIAHCGRRDLLPPQSLHGGVHRPDEHHAARLCRAAMDADRRPPRRPVRRELARLARLVVGGGVRDHPHLDRWRHQRGGRSAGCSSARWCCSSTSR